jgi:hypothetical protein
MKMKKRNTSPNGIKLWNEYLNIALDKNIAKNDAKTLMYIADIRANL